MWVSLQYINLFLEISPLVFEIQNVRHVVDDVSNTEITVIASFWLKIQINWLFIIQAESSKLLESVFYFVNILKQN